MLLLALECTCKGYALAASANRSQNKRLRAGQVAVIGFSREPFPGTTRSERLATGDQPTWGTVYL